MVRIVALDTAVTTFDGVSFEAFKTLGQLATFDRTSPAEVANRAANAEVLIVNKVVLSASLLKKLPALKYVGVTATGTNNVDLDACRELGIAVTNVVGYSTDSVAQLVFAFILDHFVKVGEYSKLVHAGHWVRSPDFCLPAIPQREISTLTLGVVGVGTIGRRVAELGRAFGMKILLGATPGRTYKNDAERVSLSELVSKSDVVTLHCALSPETTKMISEDILGQFKTGSILINVARGGLVDEKGVADALKTKQLGAYFADVLSSEPPQAENPLLSAPHVTLTPHIAWATPEARARLVHESYLNLKGFLEGNVRNRVA